MNVSKDMIHNLCNTLRSNEWSCIEYEYMFEYYYQDDDVLILIPKVIDEHNPIDVYCGWEHINELGTLSSLEDYLVKVLGYGDMV